MLASDVIDRARVVLNDVPASVGGDGIRWLNAEMFQWLTDGQRVIVLVRPDSSVANEQIALVPGTRQQIPTTGFRLLDVVRNVPDTVDAGGRAVRLIDREVMDTSKPDWHLQKRSATIYNYIYDNRNPTVYYVYPPALAGAKLEVIYSKTPAVVAGLTDVMTVSDLYADPLLNYLLFRCYSKDAQYAQNAQLASAYLQTCMALLGVKTKKDAAFSPDLHSKGAAPDVDAIKMESV